MKGFLGILNYIIGVLLLILVVAIWMTASQVLSIIFLLLLIIGGLNISGLLAHWFKVDE